jgi:hypothetical protein
MNQQSVTNKPSPWDTAGRPVITESRAVAVSAFGGLDPMVTNELS